MTRHNREFHELSEEERRDVLEARALMCFSVSGSVPGACPHCGAMFASARSALRLVRSSKKCLALRSALGHLAAVQRPDPSAPAPDRT